MRKKYCTGNGVAAERSTLRATGKTAYPEFPEIREATLGDVGGLWGALSFLNQRI